jgi:hypothetical protein
VQQPERTAPDNRGITALDGAIALIAVLVVVQMWLVSATLESYLAGHDDAALPGAIVSGLLFAGCFGLYRFIERIDREARPKADDEATPSSRF